MLKYIITGTGRCGTGYAARLLSSAGMPCGHETVFSFDGYDLLRAPGLKADSSWLAAPFLDDEDLAGIQVVHLVRHPQHVIESLVRMRFFSGEVEAYQPYLDFARKYLPSLDDLDCPIEKASFFYIYWNRLIEAVKPDAIRVRVEDGPGAILEALGIDPGDWELFDDRTYNTRGDLSEVVSLDNLPTRMRSHLRMMANEYGYELDNPPERPTPAPQVFWAFLLIPAILEHAVNSVINVAMRCGRLGYHRIMLPYMRTDRARNSVINVFKKESRNPNDVLVMLDCDHEHPFDVVERLAEHPPEMGVVGALAFRRYHPNDPLFFSIGETGALHSPATWETDGVYRCDVVGHGAVAIRRWVFDRLDEAGFGWPYYRYEYPTDFGCDQSEDVYFARCCHAAGINHYCATSVEVPHLIHAVADSARYLGSLGGSNGSDIRIDVPGGDEGVSDLRVDVGGVAQREQHVGV